MPGAEVRAAGPFSRKEKIGQMLHLSAVSKSYLGQPRVLEAVDLQLKRGDFLYVIGGSGAGKSTLLRLLATEESPTSGHLSLFGYRLDQVSPTTLRSIRRSIGYVPQNLRLIPDLSVQENVALSLSLAGKKSFSGESRLHVAHTLDRMGVGHLKDKPASELSGGEAQRVAIARALVRQPEILIADEPTGAQDPEYIWTLMDVIAKANLQGMTTILATHDREIVRRFRKPCAVLKGGRVLLEGRSPQVCL